MPGSGQQTTMKTMQSTTMKPTTMKPTMMPTQKSTVMMTTKAPMTTRKATTLRPTTTRPAYTTVSSGSTQTQSPSTGLYGNCHHTLCTSEIAYTGYVIFLHGPSMFAVKAKIYGVIYNQSSSIAFDETS